MPEEIPPEAHAWWEPAADRPHPIDLLAAGHHNVPDPESVWYEDMLHSPLAFFERSAAVMAHDLATTPTTEIVVQLCGDCRPSNFRAYIAPDRTILFDIGDFDDTLEGPWEWDIKRLAAGLALTGRNNGLSTTYQRDAVSGAVHAYRHRMIEFAAMRTHDVWNVRTRAAEVIGHLGIELPRKRFGKVRDQEGGREYGALLTRTEIVAGNRDIAEALPARARGESWDPHDRMLHMFDSYQQSLHDDQCYLLEQYRPINAAPLVPGSHSRPTRSFSLMLEGRDAIDTSFLQVTEAGPSVLEPYLGNSRHSNGGQRVVMGQRRLQASHDAFLGWLHDEGRDYHVRHVPAMTWVPALDDMGAAGLLLYADACGEALARAHARSGDRLRIAAYLGQGESFERAIAAFAELYADQVEHDHRSLVDTVRTNRLTEGAAS